MNKKQLAFLQTILTPKQLTTLLEMKVSKPKSSGQNSDRVSKIMKMMESNIDGYVVDLLEDSIKNVDLSKYDKKIQEYIKTINPELLKASSKMDKEVPIEEEIDDSYVREYLPLSKMKSLFKKMFK